MRSRHGRKVSRYRNGDQKLPLAKRRRKQRRNRKRRNKTKLILKEGDDLLLVFFDEWGSSSGQKGSAENRRIVWRIPLASLLSITSGRQTGRQGGTTPTKKEILYLK